MWKRKRKAEWLPWYRARNYKGNLTEAQKRELDAFRMQPKHPAAREHDLPEEVQNYIGRIEMELYDKKQDGAAGQALALSAIGAALLFLLLGLLRCFNDLVVCSSRAARSLAVVFISVSMEQER